MKGKDLIVAGRVRLLFDNVFFGQLATGMRLVETDQIPTMAVDGKSLFYNPEFSDKLSNPEMEGVLAHEVLHLVFMHHLRRGSRNAKLWNVAADYAINLVLKDEGFSLPSGALHSEEFKDWSTEKIYNWLKENPDQQPGGGDGWDFGGVMDQGSGGDDGDDSDATPMTKEQIDAAISDMKAKVKAATISAKKAGRLSAGMERLVNDICAPKASWREILQRFLRQKAFVDWDFSQCHTRMLHSYGIISPVIGGESLGKIAVIVDTSGSIDDKQLAQFAGEISDILSNYECEVTVIYCDTRVNREPEVFVSSDMPLQLKAVGGGGTVQKPAYDWIQENFDEPLTAIVHYSDTYVWDWDQIDPPSCPAILAHTVQAPDTSTPDWFSDRVDIS